MLGFERTTDTRARDLGLLALRLTAGGLMAGHGAQKLFGVSGGPGLQGTAGWVGSMGLKPGKLWALLAGGSEFGSGLLTATGFLSPLGPISMLAPMAMAWATVHAGKPIWATAGGAELPLINMTIATAIGLTGPGRYSLDELLGIEVPAPIAAVGAAGVATGVAAALWLHHSNAAPADDQAEAPAEPEQPTAETPAAPELSTAEAPVDQSEEPLQARALGA